MGFINFLAVLLLIYLGFRLFWMLFGRQLAVFAIKRVARTLEDEILRQQTQTSGTSRPQEHFINREMKVRYPAQPKTANTPDLKEIAEDVEFEDLRN